MTRLCKEVGETTRISINRIFLFVGYSYYTKESRDPTAVLRPNFVYSSLPKTRRSNSKALSVIAAESGEPRNGEDREEISWEGCNCDGFDPGYRLRYRRAAGLGGRFSGSFFSQAGLSMSLQLFIF